VSPVQTKCVREGQRVTGSRRCCAGLIKVDGVCLHKDAPDPTTTTPAPKPTTTTTAAPSKSRIGSYGNPSIDKWDSVILAAVDAVERKRGVKVNPRILKSIMGVESGQNGDYPPSRCRPSDATDNVPACGPFQIKHQYHKYRCPECDFTTVAGQAELAAHILGMTMKGEGLDEIEAFLQAYFTADDINGTTQREYVAKIREDVAAMERDAGVVTTTTPAVTTYVGHDLPGTTETLWLPHWVGYREFLTPIGGNRRGTWQAPSVTVFHTTNNVSRGTDAMHHAIWQKNGTQGNPGIGVHAYVDDHEVVWTIPINEKGVHSGDWRNDVGIAIERCTNADADQAEAENNAMHVHAGLLYILGKTAADAMYPHTNGGHCPRLTRPWAEVERIVDLRIGRIRAQKG
jgi:hypothetical protein